MREAKKLFGNVKKISKQRVRYAEKYGCQDTGCERFIPVGKIQN